MKGKKSDPKFLEEFISQCVSSNHMTTEEIVREAKRQISEIDIQIQRVEKLKLTRSKLLDVVYAFEKPSKSKVEEAKLLSFFQIQNPTLCRFICEQVKEKTVFSPQLKHSSFSEHDIIFCLKQMLERKIVSRVKDTILRGECFDQYMKFVLHETQ